MAGDTDDELDNTVQSRSSLSLSEQIKKLEREKAELESRESEKEMLKKLKELQGDIVHLKSSVSSSSPSCSSDRKSPNNRKSPKRNSQGSRNVSFSLEDSIGPIGSGNTGLSDLHSRLRSIQQVKDEDSEECSRRSDHSSESSENDDNERVDKVMSREHKHLLQNNRDTLVESMIPDDIFNDLIANKIISTADVSRIKERNTRESMNEELLNNLMRRSDRGFRVFVKSLRKTLQGYLANVIDPPKSNKKKKRKRRSGEINVSVDCDEVIPLNKKRSLCSCEEVEQQILEMSKNAFRLIRRRDATPAGFEQFRKELSHTNQMVKESMEIMNSLKILCTQCRSVSGISEGSVVYLVLCHTPSALKDLWQMYTSGKLEKLFQTGLVTKELLLRCRVRSVRLSVYISKKEYLECLKELEIKLNKNGLHSVKTGSLSSHHSPVCTRSMTKANVENFVPVTSHFPIPFYERQQRMVFKEIPKNISPSYSPKIQTAAVRTHCEKAPVISKGASIYNTRPKTIFGAPR